MRWSKTRACQRGSVSTSYASCSLALQCRVLGGRIGPSPVPIYHPGVRIALQRGALPCPRPLPSPKGKVVCGWFARAHQGGCGDQTPTRPSNSNVLDTGVRTPRGSFSSGTAAVRQSHSKPSPITSGAISGLRSAIPAADVLVHICGCPTFPSPLTGRAGGAIVPRAPLQL
jgi:hypothetical protein